MDDLELMEIYIILLLGANDNAPIPSATHLQKEIFLLSKANPKIDDVVAFEKHYYGPFSYDLDSVSKSPIYNSNAYFQDSRERYHLTQSGIERYNEIIDEMGSSNKVKELLAMVKMLRDLYDNLSTDELLFLIYLTYPEYTEKSVVSKELLSMPKRKVLAGRLMRKGIISEKRYKEIMGG